MNTPSDTGEMQSPQMRFHRKPNGGNEPCDICGCHTRKGTEHRALTAEEAWKYRAPYVKRVSVAFGHDTEERLLDWDGKTPQVNR